MCERERIWLAGVGLDLGLFMGLRALLGPVDRMTEGSSKREVRVEPKVVAEVGNFLSTRKETVSTMLDQMPERGRLV